MDSSKLRGVYDHQVYWWYRYIDDAVLDLEQRRRVVADLIGNFAAVSDDRLTWKGERRGERSNDVCPTRLCRRAIINLQTSADELLLGVMREFNHHFGDEIQAAMDSKGPYSPGSDNGEDKSRWCRINELLEHHRRRARWVREWATRMRRLLRDLRSS